MLNTATATTSELIEAIRLHRGFNVIAACKQRRLAQGTCLRDTLEALAEEALHAEAYIARMGTNPRAGI